MGEAFGFSAKTKARQSPSVDLGSWEDTEPSGEVWSVAPGASPPGTAVRITGLPVVGPSPRALIGVGRGYWVGFERGPFGALSLWGRDRLPAGGLQQVGQLADQLRNGRPIPSCGLLEALPLSVGAADVDLGCLCHGLPAGIYTSYGPWREAQALAATGPENTVRRLGRPCRYRTSAGSGDPADNRQQFQPHRVAVIPPRVRPAPSGRCPRIQAASAVVSGNPSRIARSAASIRARKGAGSGGAADPADSVARAPPGSVGGVGRVGRLRSAIRLSPRSTA